MAGMMAVDLDELEQVTRHMNTKWRALVAIGVTTGCRISELLSLQRKDLADRSGQVRNVVRLLKLKTRGIGIQSRNLKIPASVRPIVQQHLDEEAYRGYDYPHDYVFRGKHGKSLSRFTAYKVFYALLGPRHGTHWMRKTFAQKIYARYKHSHDPIEALENTRLALGHARMDTTVKYLGIRDAEFEQVQADAFAGLHI